MGTEGSLSELRTMQSKAWKPAQPEAVSTIDEAIRSNAAGHGSRIGAQLISKWLKEKHNVRVSPTAVLGYMKRRAKEIGVSSQ